jgi:hypothetical protein
VNAVTGSPGRARLCLAVFARAVAGTPFNGKTPVSGDWDKCTTGAVGQVRVIQPGEHELAVKPRPGGT